MAIQDMKGTVSTTGMVNSKPAKIQAPDMSKMSSNQPLPQDPTKPVNPFQPKPTGPVLPKEEGLLPKVENLTNEDKAVLSTVLSPSVSNVLVKLAPELAPLIEAAGVKEENVIIPVSMFTNFAVKRYSGDQTQAVQNLVADMSGETMGQTNVPPDTQMAEQPESGMEQQFNTLDTEGEVV